MVKIYYESLCLIFFSPFNHLSVVLLHLLLFSFSSEFDEASIIVNEQQRGVGRLTFQSTKHSEYGSSPPNRLETTGSFPRGNFGRWDAHSSGTSNKDGDVQSNHEGSTHGLYVIYVTIS